ncbi:hypothetical protein BDV10DRAFT_182267 [Aspergillus recurvatus]
MSLGFSPGDFVLLVNGIVRLTEILRGGAVEGFERCVDTFHRFSLVVQALDDIPQTNPTLTLLLQDTRKGIFETLKTFFQSIEQFSKYLGPERGSNVFLGAIMKVRWSRHVERLDQLRKDLDSHLLAISFCSVANLRTGIPRLPPEPRFTLEDANRETRRLSFREVPSWPALHEFLLNIWTTSARGADSIARKEYLFYKATAHTELLPSSPYVKPLGEFVAADQKIEMSVIFPLRESHYEQCPKCSRRYAQQSLSSPVVTCYCGFWVHFRDSYPNEPDPLTTLALRDIIQNDLPGFSRRFEKTIEQGAAYSKTLNQKETERQVDQHLRNSIPTLLGRRASKIRDFRRVTLCQARWPGSRQFSSILGAQKFLDTTMDGVKHCLDLMAAGSGLAFDAVAKMIGGRFLRVTSNADAYLQPIWKVYRERCRKSAGLSAQVRFLDIYSRCAQKSDNVYHPFIVRIRCFLWIAAVLLNLEARILVGVSEPLARSYRKTYQAPDHPIFVRAISPLWIPHVIIGRLTFDLLVDARALVFPDEPAYFFAVIYRVLADSKNLCLTYLTDRTLGNYPLDLTPQTFFNDSFLTSNAVLDQWRSTYRQHLEKVLETGLVSMPQGLVVWCTTF